MKTAKIKFFPMQALQGMRRIVVGLCATWLFATAAFSADLPATNGAFYALSVSNLATAVDWYENQLGFEVVSTSENESRKGALLSRPGVLLELAEFADAAARHPAVQSHQLYGIFKLGFVTDDIDATFAALSSSGVDVFFPIVEASDGQRTFGIRDMDGNIVQFFGE